MSDGLSRNDAVNAIMARVKAQDGNPHPHLLSWAHITHEEAETLFRHIEALRLCHEVVSEQLMCCHPMQPHVLAMAQQASAMAQYENLSPKQKAAVDRVDTPAAET